MGLLLLQNKNRRKPPVPNPNFHSLNVVYSTGDGSGGSTNGDVADYLTPKMLDLSSLPISFIPEGYLEKEITMTMIPSPL